MINRSPNSVAADLSERLRRSRAGRATPPPPPPAAAPQKRACLVFDSLKLLSTSLFFRFLSFALRPHRRGSFAWFIVADGSRTHAIFPSRPPHGAPWVGRNAQRKVVVVVVAAAASSGGEVNFPFWFFHSITNFTRPIPHKHACTFVSQSIFGFTVFSSRARNFLTAPQRRGGLVLHRRRRRKQHPRGSEFKIHFFFLFG